MSDPVYSTAQLGAVIRHARARQGISQADLAARAGVERQWVVLFENGRAPGASMSTVIRVLDELGLRLTVEPAPEGDEFFLGDPR
jgi:HTH-type transcriptional regulator / antitoxin HipB